MPVVLEGLIQQLLLGALLSPLAWAARPAAFDFDQSFSSSSSAGDSQHATLTVNEIEKFEVVQISTKEMMRLRTKGMRLHEVRHRHFNRDPKGPNSFHGEQEDGGSDGRVGVAVQAGGRQLGQRARRPSNQDIANALLEREAGNATALREADGWPWSSSKKECPEHVKDQWYELHFALREKGDGHFYLRCEGQTDTEELKASCLPDECGGEEWCFVKRGCGGWFGGRCRKLDDVDLRQCFSEPGDAQGPSGKTSATTTTTGSPSSVGEDFLPPLKISPSSMAGFVCVQFDLDLMALTGGVFPGLFSVGLLGDVHYIPSTQCWGWTAELYLQLSMGIDIGGLPFRISFVFIATLVVTEEPLNSASSQLSWELPYNMDTSVCHTKDPFTLIERTLKSQWKYVVTHVLTTRQSQEDKVKEALKVYNKDNRFADYIPLLKDNFAPKKWQEIKWHEVMDQMTGMDTDTKALVDPTPGNGRLDVNITRNDSQTITITISVIEAPDDVEALRVAVWQDWTAMITRQDSMKFPLLKQNQEFTWSFRTRGTGIVVGSVWLMSAGGSAGHGGPFTIGMTNRFGRPHPIGFSKRLDVGVRRIVADMIDYPGTLAITSLTITDHNCPNEPESVRVSIATADDSKEEATWYLKDMGKKAPWGVHVNRRHGLLQVPNEGVKLLDGMKPIVKLGNLLWREVATILRAGLKAGSSDPLNSRWLSLWNAFMADARKAVEVPSGQALDILDRSPVTDYVLALIWAQRNTELHPSSVDFHLRVFISQLQYRLEGYRPSVGAHTSWKWARLEGRSVNADPQQCHKLGPDMDLNSTEACMERCRALRPETCKDKACAHGRFGPDGKAEPVCNVARTDIADGICTAWHCTSWENFPYMDAYEVFALLPEDDILASPMPFPEVLKHVSKDQLAEALQELGDDELREVVDGVSMLENANLTWNSVRSAAFPEKTEIAPGKYEPDWKLLNVHAVKDLLLRCLVLEDGWPRVPQIVDLLKTEFSHNDSSVPVKVVVRDAEGHSGRQSFSIKDSLDTTSSNWTQKIEVRSYNCRIHATIEWKWHLQPLDGFFVRPKLVGVSQALFAAYDQFASKLPAYSGQVKERLDPKPDKAWYDFSWEKLPYKNSDGRYLHRHLKEGEHESVKVHAGDLGTDDAVYNFKKAWQKSKYARTPSFHYNAGLSLANLFLRVVSDFQALFFLYFANHPDWDGQCNSLPASFHLFHEHPKRRNAWERTNWDQETAPSTSGKLKRKDPSAAPKITHRAGSTVSDLGKEMTEDDLALFREWHWISRPYWFGSDEKRARFMSKTTPTHGKDGWATQNVSDLSAEMWPHLWCELVNQYWVKEETDLLANHTKEQSASSARIVEELLAGVDDKTETAGVTGQVVAALHKVQHELRSDPFQCPEQASDTYKMEVSKTALDSFVNFQLRDAEETYKSTLNKTEMVGDLFQEIVNFLRVDLSQAEMTEDEAKAKAMQAEISKLESTARTVGTLLAGYTEARTSMERIREAISQGWKLSSGDTSPDPNALAKFRAQFLQTKEDMEISQQQRTDLYMEAQGQIERLLKSYPYAPTRDDDKEEEKEEDEEEEEEVEQPSVAKLADIRKAISYTGSLLASVAISQKRLLEEFQLMFLCVDIASRPIPLTPTRFMPWVPIEHKSRAARLRNVMGHLRKDTDSSLSIRGIDLWFEKACRVSPDYDFSSGAGDNADKLLDEPRHECERVLLSKQLVTILPSFAERVVGDFMKIQVLLDKLVQDPTNTKTYEGLERVVRGFVESLRDTEDLDRDFLTAFAYKIDGSLSGDLWVSLKDSSATIVASLQERSQANRDWISETIRDKALLEKGRRKRVRNPEEPKPEIPTTAESCVCRDDWTAWIWYTFPVRKRFEGCSKFPKDGGALYFTGGGLFGSEGVNTFGWKGFCRTKTKRNGLGTCAEKWAPCDPNVTVDTRPEYRIWRRDHARGVVTLPLVQTDFYMSFEVQTSRSDFCTPNFAPILIKHTKHWSSASWVPWEIRKDTCWGVRLHPPGVSVLVLRCDHGQKGQKLQPRSIEWQVVFTAYLVSYYNVWGTSDGDMTQSWFDGSWGSTAADSSFPGALTDTNTWATPTAADGGGFGYMNTGQVMSSGPGFWLAMIGETIGVFQTSKAVADAKGAEGSGMTATMSAVAYCFWQVMQRWGVVPLAWGLQVGVREVSRFLQSVTGISLSGWRNEHDVVLAVQWSYMKTQTVRSAKDLVRDLSKGQLRRAMTLGQEVVPFAEYWKDYQQQVGHDPTDVRHLSHRMLRTMITTWLEQVKLGLRDHPENALTTCSQKMFEGCVVRPRWYKVSKDPKLSVHAFFGKSFEKWLEKRREPGEELFLLDNGDGWFREIVDPSEEDHFFPTAYFSGGALEVHYDVIENKGYHDRQVTPRQFEWLLQAASRENLKCWASVAHSEMPQIQQMALEKYDEGHKDDVLRVGSFARAYTQDFFWDTWQRFVHGDNRTKLTELLFRRDDSTKFQLVAKEAKEVGWFRRHSWDVSLSLLHRIGMPFLKVPMLLQVQPFVQLAIAFNVKEVVQAIMARVGKKGKPSMLESHKKRVEKCKACVRNGGSAFCDRHPVATGMLKAGWSEDMDECMPRSVDSKILCQSFAWNSSSDASASEASGRPVGGVFRDQMCPCYNQRSGDRTGPRWITSESHCAEMKWPNADSEEDRRQMKASDWKLGFAKIGKRRKNRLMLNDELDFQARPKGCEPGYDCCQSFYQGEEIHRCVELDGIMKTTSWFYRKKCYNYRPTDLVADKKWKGVDKFLCAPSATNDGSGFNGTWKVDESGKWVEKVLEDAFEEEDEE